MRMVLLSLLGLIIGFFIVGLTMRLKVSAQGLTITSWFRNPLKNLSVGGQLFSQHQYFMAIDVAETDDLAKQKLKRAGYKIVINEGDHLHAQRFRKFT